MTKLEDQSAPPTTKTLEDQGNQIITKVEDQSIQLNTVLEDTGTQTIETNWQIRALQPTKLEHQA